MPSKSLDIPFRQESEAGPSQPRQSYQRSGSNDSNVTESSGISPGCKKPENDFDPNGHVCRLRNSILSDALKDLAEDFELAVAAQTPSAHGMQIHLESVLDSWIKECATLNKEFDKFTDSTALGYVLRTSVAREIPLQLDEFLRIIKWYRTVHNGRSVVLKRHSESAVVTSTSSTSSAALAAAASDSVLLSTKKEEQEEKRPECVPPVEEELSTMQLFALFSSTQTMGMSMNKFVRSMRDIRRSSETVDEEIKIQERAAKKAASEEKDDKEKEKAAQAISSTEMTPTISASTSNKTSSDLPPLDKMPFWEGADVVSNSSSRTSLSLYDEANQEDQNNKVQVEKYDFCAAWRMQRLRDLLTVEASALVRVLQEKTLVFAATLSRDLTTDTFSHYGCDEAKFFSDLMLAFVPPETEQSKKGLPWMAWFKEIKKGLSQEEKSEKSKENEQNVCAELSLAPPVTAASLFARYGDLTLPEERDAIRQEFANCVRRCDSPFRQLFVSQPKTLGRLYSVCPRAAAATLALRKPEAPQLRAIDPRLPTGTFFGKTIKLGTEDKASKAAAMRENSKALEMGRVFHEAQKYLTELERSISRKANPAALVFEL